MKKTEKQQQLALTRKKYGKYRLSPLYHNMVKDLGFVGELAKSNGVSLTAAIRWTDENEVYLTTHNNMMLIKSYFKLPPDTELCCNIEDS